MNKKTKALIGFTIGALIGTVYSSYELYKYVDTIERENSKLNWDLTEITIKHSYLKNDYKKLYDNMTDEEKEQYRLNFPFSIPTFIKL